jgi:very-short-patch-repair endonuclease
MTVIRSDVHATAAQPGSPEPPSSIETLAFSAAMPVFEALIRARCESEAEENMATALIAGGFNTRVVFRAICHGDRDLLEQNVMGIHLTAGQVTQQHPMPAGGKDYRLDFALPRFRIGIEVDGHDWHEKTKQQASYDRARDRAIQRVGWRLLRFTGSDVYRNAKQCVREILEDALKSPLSVEKIDPKPSKQIDVAWVEDAAARKNRIPKMLTAFKGPPKF